MHPNEGSGGGTFVDGLIDFTAGSLGGMALVYVGQPLDTVKVKLQTFPHLYSGRAWDCFKRTLLDEGVRRGLYAGTVPALVANVAENSVLFAAYGSCQKFMAFLTGQKKVEELSTLSNATAGFLAAFFSSFTLCPTELIKVKLQAARELELTGQTSQLKNMPRLNAFSLTRSILKNEGVRGMFRGLGSTIVREMPGYFVFFGGYEGTRTLLAPKGGTKDDCGPVATMTAGAVGGVALWTVIFPADLVKSRIQVSSLSGSFYTNTVAIVRNEGIWALYNGLSPTLLRTIPATAVLFLTYETVKKLLHSVLD